MSNIAVRGMASQGSLVTAGLGPADGTTFVNAAAGAIAMSGELTTEFIDGVVEAIAQGIAIDIGIATS